MTQNLDLQNLHSAVLPDHQYAAGTLAEYAVQSSLVFCYCLIFHKGLDSSGKAAAVYTADAVAAENGVADCQGHRYVLVGNVVVGVYVLEIFEGGIAGGLYSSQERLSLIHI